MHRAEISGLTLHLFGIVCRTAVALLRPVASQMTWAIDAPVESAKALGVGHVYAIDRPASRTEGTGGNGQ
jgi:hypothetical protein